MRSPPLDSSAGTDLDLSSIAPIDSIDPYTDSMIRAETLVLGLRLNRGVADTDYRERFGARPSDLFGKAIETSITDGLLERDGEALRLTPRGRLLSNEVFVRIMANA